MRYIIKNFFFLFFVIPVLGFVLKGRYIAGEQSDEGIPPRIHVFPGEPVIYSPSGKDIVLYEKQASLSAAMKQIQKTYSAWQTRQLQSLEKVREGTFYTTRLMAEGSAELRGPAGGAFDKDAKRQDGTLVWEALEERGQRDLIVSSSTRGRDQTAFLAWVTESKEECALSVGLYGGDRMKVWLNGKEIFKKDNVFEFPDYWWNHEKKLYPE